MNIWAVEGLACIGILRLALCNFRNAEAKAKGLREILDRFDGTATVLIVDLAGNRELEISSRNLADVEVVSNRELHPYHLLHYKRLLLSRPAVERLQEALAR